MEPLDRQPAHARPQGIQKALQQNAKHLLQRLRQARRSKQSELPRGRLVQAALQLTLEQRKCPQQQLPQQPQLPLVQLKLFEQKGRPQGQLHRSRHQTQTMAEQSLSPQALSFRDMLRLMSYVATGEELTMMVPTGLRGFLRTICQRSSVTSPPAPPSTRLSSPTGSLSKVAFLLAIPSIPSRATGTEQTLVQQGGSRQLREMGRTPPTASLL